MEGREITAREVEETGNIDSKDWRLSQEFAFVVEIQKWAQMRLDRVIKANGLIPSKNVHSYLFVNENVFSSFPIHK